MFYDKDMYFLSKLWKTLLDFIFPKSQEVLILESLSTKDIVDILPTAETPRAKEIMALFDYSHKLTKEMIWELKYNGNKILAEKFGEIIYNTIYQELNERNFFTNLVGQTERPIIIPIPISDKRRLQRGWNQTELLLDGLKKTDVEHRFKYLPRQLIKVIHTESQTRTSNKTERSENIQNTMAILNPHTVSGRYVIVIDDVTTTGSTFLEAKRALKEAGAKEVFCIAIAH